jgi:two-component system cell cycle sensor histidine kinase/response regulator CckA
MGIPLRVLMIEDSVDDAALLLRELQRGGYDVNYERVDTAAALKAALVTADWDLAVSDYSMPQFSGMDALKLVRKKGYEIPFIFVSGTIGEETAVEALKNGAQDYLMKGRLQRLVPAIQRELREREAHSERKRLEQQLNQAQKMEAVGRLAGGIAHDFNNMLGVIIGYSDLVLDSVDQDSPTHRNVTQIKRAGERAASLTRQLLAFSRQQVLEPRVMNLNTAVAEMDKMLRRLIGADIDLESRLDSNLGAVKADPGHMEQVILNLAVNARDAMPQGGKLTIETTNVELDEIHAQLHPPMMPGRFVMLAVTDNGTGMSRETQAHIFEPFFTTKEVGKGTGLGLATVHGVVSQNNGFIYVYSEPGQGTTFKIYLPLVEEAVEATYNGLPEVTEERGTETILLVEDTEPLRELACIILKGCGYTVIEASNGAEALVIARRERGPIHLLLTDVIMPIMGGPELCRLLTAERPELRVLYLSGYTDAAIVRHNMLDPGLALLQKPFTKKALLRKVRNALDRGAAARELMAVEAGLPAS